MQSVNINETKESRVKPLTQKAINSIVNTGYLNVWEGAVRSSKTVSSEIAWGKYLTESPENVFIMSGKTIASLYKNVIGGDFGLLAMFGSKASYHRDPEGNRVFELQTAHGVKKCYCASGDNERSFQKIRGITAGGWYADEVNLQPRSFIEECLRRTIVSRDRRNFWTLNPDNPNHFIYTDFIDKYTDENLEGFHLWKFYLDDNLAITEERKEELKKQYTGLFYRRYILGERCVAEGVIYDMFSNERHLYDNPLDPGFKRKCDHYIAVDYGTTNPCRFLDIYDDGTDIWIDKEFSWDSKKEQRQKTDREYLMEMRTFAVSKDPIIVIDPSAESFQVELSNDGFYVKQADNDVQNGIRTVSNLLSQNHMHICKQTCPELIKEFGAYIWDAKLASEKGEEKPIKKFDHSLDALRYFCYTILPSWRTGVKRNIKNNAVEYDTEEFNY